MILHKNNNNQGVFLELLVAAKNTLKHVNVNRYRIVIVTVNAIIVIVTVNTIIFIVN